MLRKFKWYFFGIFLTSIIFLGCTKISISANSWEPVALSYITVENNKLKIFKSKDLSNNTVNKDFYFPNNTIIPSSVIRDFGIYNQNLNKKSKISVIIFPDNHSESIEDGRYARYHACKRIIEANDKDNITIKVGLEGDFQSLSKNITTEELKSQLNIDEIDPLRMQFKTTTYGQDYAYQSVRPSLLAYYLSKQSNLGVLPIEDYKLYLASKNVLDDTSKLNEPVIATLKKNDNILRSDAQLEKAFNDMMKDISSAGKSLDEGTLNSIILKHSFSFNTMSLGEFLLSLKKVNTQNKKMENRIADTVYKRDLAIKSSIKKAISDKKNLLIILEIGSKHVKNYINGKAGFSVVVLNTKSVLTNNKRILYPSRDINYINDIERPALVNDIKSLYEKAPKNWKQTNNCQLVWDGSEKRIVHTLQPNNILNEAIEQAISFGIDKPKSGYLCYTIRVKDANGRVIASVVRIQSNKKTAVFVFIGDKNVRAEQFYKGLSFFGEDDLQKVDENKSELNVNINKNQYLLTA